MIILDAKLEGRLQIAAALALLRHSRLVCWVPNGPGFVAAQRDAFEATWPKGVCPVFGRVICWILFSAGAEFASPAVSTFGSCKTFRSTHEAIWTRGLRRFFQTIKHPAQ
jgi:hypothetical protein